MIKLTIYIENTKRKIFTLHTSKMSLNDDVELDEFINQKDDLSGADIKAICSEAGLMALRERRMRVQMADFRAARERVMKTKTEGEPEVSDHVHPSQICTLTRNRACICRKASRRIALGGYRNRLAAISWA